MRGSLKVDPRAKWPPGPALIGLDYRSIDSTLTCMKKLAVMSNARVAYSVSVSLSQSPNSTRCLLSRGLSMSVCFTVCSLLLSSDSQNSTRFD